MYRSTRKSHDKHCIVRIQCLSWFCFLYSPEPHILLFRRRLGTDPQTGRVDPELEELARQEYKNQPGLRANALQ